MINGIQFKVCGLTRPEDARAAADAGADFLGFIFYPKSPRNIRQEAFGAMREQLPNLPKVAVVVAPTLMELDELDAHGFDFFQIHFSRDTATRVSDWSATVGKDRLWLAPKWAPGTAFDAALLEFSDAILWDAYKSGDNVYGGTGKRSDWDSFRVLREEHASTRWILAGGLSPENAEKAVAQTGARFLDFNSGVEIRPGIKDHNRLSLVRNALSHVD